MFAYMQITHKLYPKWKRQASLCPVNCLIMEPGGIQIPDLSGSATGPLNAKYFGSVTIENNPMDCNNHMDCNGNGV